MAKCIDCKHMKNNPDFDYYKYPEGGDVALCEIESDFWEGGIQAVGFEIEITCDDFEVKEGSNDSI